MTSLGLSHWYTSLRWRHNGHDSVSNHQPHDVFSTVYLDADQRKHQGSASLAFVRGIHRRPVNSPHKWPVTRKMFPFDDVIMISFRWCTFGTVIPNSELLEERRQLLRDGLLDFSKTFKNAILGMAITAIVLGTIGKFSVHWMWYQTIWLSNLKWTCRLGIGQVSGRKRLTLTHRGRDKIPPSSRLHIQMHFLECKCMNFD